MFQGVRPSFPNFLVLSSLTILYLLRYHGECLCA